MTVDATCKSADEIVALCKQIDEVTRASQALGVARPIISNAIDHLSAIARIHRLNLVSPPQVGAAELVAIKTEREQLVATLVGFSSDSPLMRDLKRHFHHVNQGMENRIDDATAAADRALVFKFSSTGALDIGRIELETALSVLRDHDMFEEAGTLKRRTTLVDEQSLVAAPVHDGWLPIESAPKNGTRIICATNNAVAECYWGECRQQHSENIGKFGWINANGSYFGATKWQPLPSPPASP